MNKLTVNRTFSWNVTKIQGKEFTQVAFQQPNSTILDFGADALEPGKYVACLKVTNENTDAWYEDCMVIEILYPSLVTRINGADVITVPINETITIDASSSYDPAKDLQSVQNQTLYCKWSIKQYGPQESTGYYPLKIHIKNFREDPNVTTLSNSCSSLSLNPTGIQDGFVLVRFSMERDTRFSDVFQAIVFTNGLEPLSIE